MIIVPATGENIRNILVRDRETGEHMTLEQALRRLFDNAYAGSEAEWAEVFQEKPK